MKRIMILILLAVSPALFASEWKEQEVRGYLLKWQFDGGNLNIEISYKTDGWIAVGFDAENKMKGANIIIGTVTEQGAYLEDHYGTGPFSHRQDTALNGRDNITAADGSQSGGKTTLKFTIPADSGDEFDKPIIEGEQYRVIFASSSSDSLGRKHGNRTGADIRF